MSYIPRAGTRARAVFDVLQDGQEHRWRELFEDYRLAVHPYSNPHYISLTLGRLLRKIATRVRRGVYVRKLMEKNTEAGKLWNFAPDLPPALPPVIMSGSYTGPLPVNQGLPLREASDEVTILETELHKLTEELKVKENANRAQGDKIRSLDSRLTEVAVELNRLESANAQLEHSKESYKDDYIEACSQNDVLQEQIKSRDVVIKNQLGWIQKLEQQVGKLQSKLGEIAAIAECE